MAQPSNFGKNVVIVAALLGAAGLVVVRRLPHLLFDQSSYTDGASVYENVRAEGVRHAVWDTPEPLSGEVNTPARESRPSLSPDGRWLAFASGEPGLGSDLWLAEIVDGEPREARPMGGLNTPADELAPAFGAGALYFASDRAHGAGGFDLWRAPFAEGVTGAPEPVGGGLNTPFDELDPAPGRSPRGEALLAFASDREPEQSGDFDLFLAFPERPAAAASGEVELWALEGLNSAADEREPAFSGDGRTLYFASSRSGDGGEFGLYRSLREGDGWLAPRPLEGLAGGGSRRAPAPSADGFTLLFEGRPAPVDDLQDGPRDAGDLFRARSIELFRLPEPDLGWYDLVLLGLLLALALLAILAKRWSQLEIIYKCFLISLLVHLLLMLLLRAVHPEGGALVPGERDEGPTFQVRVLRDSSLASVTRERGGSLEAERSEALFAPAPTRLEAQASPRLPGSAPVRELELASAEPAAAPERALAAVERSASAPAAPAPATAAPRESFERLDAAAPALAVAPAAPAVERPAASADEPNPAALASTETGGESARPSTFSAERPASEVARAPGFSAADVGRASPAAVDAPALSAPSESFERLAGESPVLAASSESARFTREDAAAAPRPDARAEVGALAPASDAGPAQPAASGLALRGDALPASASAAAAGVARAFEPRTTAGATRQLAAPAERFERLAQESSTGAPELPSAAAFSPAAPPGEEASGLARVASDVSQPRAPREQGAPAVEPPEVRGAALASAPQARRVEGLARAFEPTPAARSSVDLAAPRERFERLAAETDAAAEERLPEASAFAPAAPTELDAAQAPTERWSDVAAFERDSEGLARAPEAAPLELRGDTSEAPRTTSSSSPAARSFAPSALRETALALPRERFEERHAALPDEAPPVLPEASAFARARPLEASAVPERWSAPLAAAAPVRDEPPPRARLDARPQESAPELPAAPRRLEETPYRARFGDEKEIALEEHGGGEDTERAVALGLAYLASIQNRDGSWGDVDHRDDKYRQVAVGKTGLSLLAFMGAGHTPGGASEHAEVARRAVDFLLSVQGRRSGQFGDTSAYGHGIATYALAECYALTKQERLRAPLERAVRTILRNQVRRGDRRLVGGWSYYYADGAVYDGWPRVSVTAWQVMALESARLGGLEVPDAVFAAARSFLLRSWDGRMGAFRYSHDPQRLNSGYATLPGSTPAALFALGLLGEDVGGEDYDVARRFVVRRAPSGYRWQGDDAFVHRAAANLYFWYYGSLALFRIGGPEWERWNVALKESLLPSQAEDGSWEPLSVYADYAADDDEDKSYTTAMCVLSLEVYYRYFTPLLEVR